MTSSLSATAFSNTVRVGSICFSSRTWTNTLTPSPTAPGSSSVTRRLMKPSRSSVFTLVRQGEGESPTLSASSTLGMRAFSCNTDNIFQSIESSRVQRRALPSQVTDFKHTIRRADQGGIICCRRLGLQPNIPRYAIAVDKNNIAFRLRTSTVIASAQGG